MIFFHNVIFFSLSLSCSSVFSTVLTFDSNKIQTAEVFFLFSTETLRQFRAHSSLSSSMLWQKSVWFVRFYFRLKLCFDPHVCLMLTLQSITKNKCVLFGIDMHLEEILNFKGPKLLNVSFPYLLHYKADPHSHFNII